MVSTSEDTDSDEAIIVIEESFASGQVSAQVTILGVIAVMNPSWAIILISEDLNEDQQHRENWHWHHFFPLDIVWIPLLTNNIPQVTLSLGVDLICML